MQQQIIFIKFVYHPIELWDIKLIAKDVDTEHFSGSTRWVSVRLLADLSSLLYDPGGFTLHMTGYAPACTKSVEKGSCFRHTAASTSFAKRVYFSLLIAI